MDKEISNIVVIDRYDYDELVEKANMTDKEIDERAKYKFKIENEIPVRIEFNQYRNKKNFSAPIGFIRCGDKIEGIAEALNELEPKIKAWMDENLSMIDRDLKDRGVTKKICIDLGKRVNNLDVENKALKIKFTFSLCFIAALLLALIIVSLI